MGVLRGGPAAVETMPTRIYKEMRHCRCGYNTTCIKSWSQHKNRCYHASSHQELSDRIALLQEEIKFKDVQLVAKDDQIKTLSKVVNTKDDQIKSLTAAVSRAAASKIATTTTINNNNFIDVNVNVFGKETTSHISPQHIQALLADPPNAVSQFIKLKHRRAPGGINDNVRVPNKKRAIYQVVVRGEGAMKEWENRSKIDVLEQMYDENSGELEAEADDRSRVGQGFLHHQDRVRASVDGADGGKRYKEQLEKIHCVVSQ